MVLIESALTPIPKIAGFLKPDVMEIRSRDGLLLKQDSTTWQWLVLLKGKVRDLPKVLKPYGRTPGLLEAGLINA